MRRHFSTLLLLLTLLATALGAPPPAANAAASDAFADPAIRAVWARVDGPVANGQARRPWTWGPGPFYSTYEPLDGTPTGTRLVQYFDKGRIEINDPGANRSRADFVSTGRLVAEMVTGRIGTGSGAADYEERPPAAIPVAGEDVGAAGAPAYRAFAAQMERAADRTGQQVTARLAADGSLSNPPTPPAAVQNAYYEPGTGHNIADVFWAAANAVGPVNEGGTIRNALLFNWVATLGLPISEPLWVPASIGGQPRLILVQLFERRVLLYTPGGPVEQANVGRHYYSWRYGNPLGDDKTAQTRTRYNVTAAVSKARTLTVRQTVRYTNTLTNGQPMKEVVLRAIYHRWPGALTITAATAGGQAVTPRWRDDVNLNVPFSAPLPPGATTDFTLDYTLKPQPFGGRHGYDKNTDLLALGDWLPTVVPYENGGPLQFPYADIGDQGINEVADYTVEFTTADNMVIGGTGTAQVREARRWLYSAPAVRDVAYILSSRLLNPYTDPSLTRKVGGTTLRGFFLPTHRAQAGPLLDLAASALRWYGNKISPYPHSQYLIAEMGYPSEPQWDYAQEYPQTYFIPTQRVTTPLTPGQWAWLTPVHEVAHQWYYSTVGNSQLQDPWLDEALASFLNAEYVRGVRPDLYNSAWNRLIGPGVGRPVSSGLFAGYGKDEPAYFRTTYDLGTVFIGEVYRTMGADRFWAALRDYTNQYQNRRAHPADLLRLWQAYSPTSLAPIFDKYLAYR